MACGWVSGLSLGPQTDAEMRMHSRVILKEGLPGTWAHHTSEGLRPEVRGQPPHSATQHDCVTAVRVQGSRPTSSSGCRAALCTGATTRGASQGTSPPHRGNREGDPSDQGGTSILTNPGHLPQRLATKG